MKQLTKFGAILGTTCLLATLILAVTYRITKPKIDEEFKKEEHEALKAILPEADVFHEKSIDGIDYFEAMDEGKVRGYCVRVTGTGYSGYIRMLVGVNTEGVIEGVEILEHYETPGLGAKIDEIKRGEKDPWFLRQFKGKKAETIEVKKNIDAITGATISSRAVTDAIRKSIDEFLSKVKQK
jgi:Na+-translocating ferredoxin:NAD+ oxidoreductase subunit G